MSHPHIPAGLDWMRHDLAASRWLDELPALIAAALQRWPGRLGEPFDGGVTSWVAPLDRIDGSPAVLKIPHVDRETRHEPDALRAWDGNGAVRLLDHDPTTGALLLERATPGHHLSQIGADAALGVVTDLLPRLLVPATAHLTDIADEAARWRGSLEGHLARHPGAIDASLAAAAREFLDELIASRRTGRVLVHQDLHGDNILAATREPWLAIDPKPLAATRAFALAPLVRSHEFGHGEQATRHRLHVLAAALDVDRAQAARHTIAQTVAWAFEPSGPIQEHLETAAWLLPETG